MENKHVGWMIMGMSALIVVIIFLFSSALKKIVSTSCPEGHSITCPINITINDQTYLALAIVGVLVIVGFVFIFSKPQEKIIVRKVKEKEVRVKIDATDLTSEEKQILDAILEKKVIFQADLIEQTGFGKAKMSRVLDRLEGKGLIERKRRGLTNVVVLKEGNTEIIQ